MQEDEPPHLNKRGAERTKGQYKDDRVAASLPVHKIE